jgi:general secretion pathway protein C
MRRTLGAVLGRHFWLVVCPMLAVAALLNAQAVTQLVGIALQPGADELASVPARARSAPAPVASGPRIRTADALLARNPFDHSASSLAPADLSPEPGLEVPSEDPWTAPACDGVDVFAIAASDDADWSFAAIAAADGKSRLHRRGGDIAGKKVVFIGRDRVWLAGEGALCQAEIIAKKRTRGGAPATATAPPAASQALRPGKPLDPDIKKGIQKVGPTTYDIDRGVLDKILENQADLMRQARIVPEQENGRVVGVKLLAVRPDSLLATLGMQTGDRLQTINGFEMASPERALEAYARLRTADKLTISMSRGGKPVNLDYNIK